MKVLIFLILLHSSCAIEIPSAVTSNASLAIVIDPDLMQRFKVDIVKDLQIIVRDVIRDNIFITGVNVKYFIGDTSRLKRDFQAILALTTCLQTWKLFEFADENEILFLAMTENNCPRLPKNKALMIPIIDNGEELPQILLDIKAQGLLKWKSCALLFDTSLTREITQMMTALFQESVKYSLDPISVYLHQYDEYSSSDDNKASIEIALRKLAKNTENNIIVYSAYVDSVVEVAIKMNMFNVFNRWLFFLTQNDVAFDTFLKVANTNEGSHISIVYNQTKVNCEESISCLVRGVIHSFILAINKVVNDENLLIGTISDEEWEAIRLSKRERNNEILAYIYHYQRKNEQKCGCFNWALRSVHAWGYDRAQNSESTELSSAYFVNTANWTTLFGVTESDRLFPHADHKFRKRVLHVLTHHNPPWQYITHDEKGKINMSAGVSIEILKELSHKLNFTYILHDLDQFKDELVMPQELTSLTTSKEKRSNVISKIIQEFATNSYFLAAIAVTIDDSDKVPVAFTIPISVQKYTFIARKPDKVSRLYLFTDPFTMKTWACIVVSVLLIPPLLNLITKYNPVDTFRMTGLMRLKNCFWYVYGALLQQGGMYLPQADSGRVVIGVWWLVVTVLVTTYCGNLVAFLTFPRYQPGVQFLSEAFYHTDIKSFGLREGAYFEKYSTISTRRDFKKFMEHVNFFNESNEDLESVKDGNRINIDWKMNLQALMRKDFDRLRECNLVLGHEEFVDEQIGMVIPKSSPFIGLINREIQRLHMMGFIERWHKTYIPYTNKCSSKSKSASLANHMVNLDDMQGCFVVLLIGFFAGIILMLLEMIFYRFCGKKPQILDL